MISAMALMILVAGSYWAARTWKRATTWEEYDLVIEGSQADRLLDGRPLKDIDTDDFERLVLTKLPPSPTLQNVQAFVAMNFKDSNPVVETDGLPPEIRTGHKRFIRATGFIEGSIFGSNRMEIYFLLSDQDVLQSVRAIRSTTAL